MGMIDRYKKAGGFLQLLNLIETCGPAKQEKFLTIVNGESQYWSAAIQQKMLNMDRILAWPEDTLTDIFKQIQELTLATALHGFEQEMQDQIFAIFSHLSLKMGVH